MPDQPDRSTQARQHARRAAELYQKRDTMGALKALGQALDLDPSLKDDGAARQLASRLTGLDDEQAVQTLSDFERRSTFIRKRRKPPARRARLLNWLTWLFGVPGVFVLLVFSLVSCALLGVLVNTLLFPTFLGRGQVERYTLERRPDRAYHVVTPHGFNSDSGWPTLVAIHGAGQTGADMVEAFRDATQSNGILLIAPTFPDMPEGEAESAFLDDARNTILLILDEVQGIQQPGVFMHYLGQVYFGYGEGARVVTELARQGLDYPDAGFTINLPLAVALANGGPALALPTYPVRFLIAVGENDLVGSVSISYANRLRAQGYDVDLQIIPGAGHELTRQQVDLTVELVRKVYSGEDSR